MLGAEAGGGVGGGARDGAIDDTSNFASFPASFDDGAERGKTGWEGGLPLPPLERRGDRKYDEEDEEGEGEGGCCCLGDILSFDAENGKEVLSTLGGGVRFWGGEELREGGAEG